MAELPPDFDPMDEAFRWCVFCKADCWPDPEFQSHDDDCPNVTGIFPIDERTMPPTAFKENGAPDIRCCRCDRTMTTHYRLVDAPGTEGADPPVKLVVCDDCAMAVELLGESA